MVIHSCQANIWDTKVEAGGLSEFETSLGYKVAILKNKIKQKVLSAKLPKDSRIGSTRCPQK